MRRSRLRTSERQNVIGRASALSTRQPDQALARGPTAVEGLEEGEVAEQHHEDRHHEDRQHQAAGRAGDPQAQEQRQVEQELDGDVDGVRDPARTHVGEHHREADALGRGDRELVLQLHRERR